MGSFSSFRSRVLLSFVLVIALGVLAPSWYMRSTLVDELRQEAKRDALRLLDFAVAGLETAGKLDYQELDRLASSLQMGLVYINEQGNVLFRAGHTPEQAGLEAGPGDAGADKLVFDDTLYFEQGILRSWKFIDAPPTGLPQGWVGIAAATNFQGEAPHTLARFNTGLLVSLVAALVLAGFFSVVLVRWLSRSIQSLVSVAEAIGQGQYKERASGFHSQELEALSRSINRMAERIEAHIRIITEQKGQFEAVLNSMNEGVMVLDASCRIRSVNRALTRIFPECLGSEGRRPLEVISSPELQRACQDVTVPQMDQKTLRTFQIEPRKNAVYDVAIVSLINEDTGPDDLGAVAVFHDISTLSRLERVRSDFVANVSHELRTPLTSIKGYAETLLQSLEGCQTGDVKSDMARRSFVEVILRNANHMSKMVNDLLNLARLEGGKKPFEAEEVDAAQALGHALKECHHLVEGHDAVIENSLEQVQALVMADMDRLVQVFRNLLENALKYGVPPEGEERQTIDIWSEERGNMILFAIQDNGPGIPKEERKRIFERFYRVEKHRAKDTSGSSGLGLAITKHMVDKMGGEIWVHSPAKDDRGVIFYLTLPTRHASTPMLVEAQMETADQPTAG